MISLSHLTIPLNSVRDASVLDDLLDKHSAVFGADLGCMKSQMVDLLISESVSPKFHKPRAFSFIMKQKVENELQRLQDMGIISQVRAAECATLIAPILNKDNTVSICSDFKVTINNV